MKATRQTQLAGNPGGIDGIWRDQRHKRIAPLDSVANVGFDLIGRKQIVLVNVGIHASGPKKFS
jgi:hypothetical protein